MKKGKVKIIVLNSPKLIFINLLLTVIVSLSIGYANEILFAGNEVSYDNSVSGLNSTTVQGALDEMCTVADFSDRVSALENKFQNNAASYFNGNNLFIGASGSSSDNTNVMLYNGSSPRGVLYYSVSGNNLNLASYDASGNIGQGTLNLRGNPVQINGVNAGKQPVSVGISSSFTSSTTFANTGISVTIPANSFYALTFRARYNNSKPSMIGVSTSDSRYTEVVSSAVGMHSANVSWTSKTVSQTTLYVWAQYASANTNGIDIYGFYIPQ